MARLYIRQLFIPEGCTWAKIGRKLGQDFLTFFHLKIVAILSLFLGQQPAGQLVVVRLSLLRLISFARNFCSQLLAASICSQLLFTTFVHNLCSQILFSTFVHNFSSQIFFTTVCSQLLAHTFCSQFLILTFVHNFCSQHLFSIFVHKTFTTFVPNFLLQLKLTIIVHIFVHNFVHKFS